MILFQLFLISYIIILKTAFILFCIKTNKHKLLTKLEIYRTQLEIVRNQKPTQIYRSTIFQKRKIAICFALLGKVKELLYIFKPETVLKWYCNIVKNFWTFPNAKNNLGRPPITKETIAEILRMKRENSSWGCRRIHGELKDKDIFVSKSKVAEILIQYGLDPTDSGLTWSKFLKSHIDSIFAFDIKKVPTLFGAQLFVFFFISHKSRRIIHFNITQHPTKDWTEQQLRNFVYDFDDRVYLIHDNDQLFKYVDFDKFNIDDIAISYQAPDMNAIVERFIGSFNRDALNNFVILSENQLRYIVKEYVTYYNLYRPHQGIGNITIPRYENNNVNELKIFHKSPKDELLKEQFLGGLLNRYYYKETA